MAKSKSKKVSLVVTVLNEVGTIELLLSSIVYQSRKPDEVVIVDGGSGDSTVDLIKSYLQMGNPAKGKQDNDSFRISFEGIEFNVLEKNGNRSVGRNWAIHNSKHSLVAITDAGCILHNNWLAELLKKADQADVVAGYYDSDPLSPFEEAVVPYVLVMPDRVNEDDFLPATRSMLMKKKVWEKLGGFDEKLSDNEDYDFARRIKPAGFSISFAKKAVVTWIPISSLSSFFRMIMRFARGDIQAGIVRPKILTVYGRYILLLIALWLNWVTGVALFLVYLWWSIKKNRKYVPRGWYYLPLLQVVSDFAVMWSSLQGFKLYIL